MIVFTRSAAIAPGKNSGAMAFAKQIAAHIKTLNGVDLEIRIPIGGMPNRVQWAATYETLGTLEKSIEKFSADAQYAQIVAAGAENFIAGTFEDSIWKTV